MRDTIDFNKYVFITPHAVLKASDLFGVDYGSEARKTILEKLKRATFVSEIVGESGKVDRLFAYRRIAFVLDRYDDVVITIYLRENVEVELREKVRELLFDHLSELQAKEKLIETDLMRIEIEYEMLKELDKVGLYEAGVWFAAVRDEIKHKKRELHMFRLDKSKVAKGIVAYL